MSLIISLNYRHFFNSRLFKCNFCSCMMYIAIKTIKLNSINYISVSQCCFFPFEMQALYAQQDYQRISNGHFYKEVNITEDTFSTIGQCYRKFGDHVIFLEG